MVRYCAIIGVKPLAAAVATESFFVLLVSSAGSVTESSSFTYFLRLFYHDSAPTTANLIHLKISHPNCHISVIQV